MRKIDEILVTTDFSDTAQVAFGLATQLADKFDARIVALHVLDLQLAPLAAEVAYAGAELIDLDRARKQHADERMNGLGDLLGRDVETAIVSGTPHVEIVRFAKERGIDLIVMATHGRGFFSHAILGSTTERVIRRSTCPVLTVRGTQTE